MQRVSWVVLGAIGAVVLALTAMTVGSTRAHGSAPFQTPSPPEDSATDVVLAGVPGAPELYIGGRRVFSQTGTHLGRPRLSPDGRWVAVTVVPAGTETARLAEVWVFARSDGQLIGRLPGSLPQWQPDGTLAVYTRERRLVFAPETGQSLESSYVSGQGEDWLFPQGKVLLPLEFSAPPEYPQTIRVKHHPENRCRDVPVGQVDEIPFEEYVARVVPAEVPPSWPLEALAAQAVAARTYAWYQILANRPDYDVTDWANFQMMCDTRYPSTDRAVAMTAGQYLSAVGDPARRPIVAMYSAENGHPTLTNPWVPYLRSVPDWAGLGRKRWGHGYGLSQWGAMRRARAGHTYRQILGHYYTGVHLQDGRGGPIAVGLVGLEPGGFAPPGGLRWATLAPHASTGLSLVLDSRIGITRTAVLTSWQTITTTQVITDAQGITHTVTTTRTVVVTATEITTQPVVLDVGRGVWSRRPPGLSGDVLTATLYLGSTAQETVTLQVDLEPPEMPALDLPAETSQRVLTVTVGAPQAAFLGLANEWTWQGEELPWTPASAAEVAPDPQADGGAVLQARAGVHTPGVWYGPYATGIPSPARYRAVFYLRATLPEGALGGPGQDRLLADEPVARLDVVDRKGTLLLGLRDIWLSDFGTSDRFQAIPVDFYLFEPPQGLEFRVAWRGQVHLALDRVELWQLRDPLPGLQPWSLGARMTTTVRAVAFDAAGNISPPITRTVRWIDREPPVFQRYGGVNFWWRRLPITVSAVVQDRGTGLDVTSGRVWLDGQLLEATFTRSEDPWAEQELQRVLTDLEEGEYAVRFQARDQAGHLAVSLTQTVRFDASRPNVTATVVLSDGAPVQGVAGWYGQPIRVQITGTDGTSGIRGIAYVLNGAPFLMYRGPFVLEAEGKHTVRYWAQDGAGNYSFSRYLSVGIDLTPPQAQVAGIPLGEDRARITWQVTDALSGLAQVEVEFRRDEGPWQPVARPESPLELAFAGAQVLEVRVRGVDRVGHVGAWARIRVHPAPHALYLPNVVTP